MIEWVVGICPSERHSTKNPPGTNVYIWVVTLLPAGTYGLALISPSVFHVPRKYSNFLCSGPGFGGSGGACASASAVNPQVRKRATDDPMLIFFSFESAFMMANPAVKCSSVSPNGWRLGGDGGEPAGVRCSGGLGGAWSGRPKVDLLRSVIAATADEFDLKAFD